MQPRRHRMRKQARRDSALAWVRSGARVTVKSYAKRYGVDRYTAYDDLTAINFPLPDTAARWAQRPPATPRRALRHTDEFDDESIDYLNWVWVGDRRMFVVGYTSGGAPFGCYEDDLEESILNGSPRGLNVAEFDISAARTLLQDPDVEQRHD